MAYGVQVMFDGLSHHQDNASCLAWPNGNWRLDANFERKPIGMKFGIIWFIRHARVAGDIRLTLAQKVPVAGSVIVTTHTDIGFYWNARAAY